MKRIEVLKGTNISLVVPDKEDTKLWTQGMNNIEVSKYLLNNFGKVWYQENEDDYYDALTKDNSQITFSIYIPKEDKVIGNLSLMEIQKMPRNAKLGISIFDTESQGKGYGTEAIELMLAHAFETLGLHKVVLLVIEYNPKAMHVYKKCGFKEVGRLKEHHYAFGTYHDELIMEIMRSEYKNNS